MEQITDSAGNIIQTYDYDAFGNVTSATGSLINEYKYKTKEYSAETGLIYFGARYYNPIIGRFVTSDPLGMVDGPNMYLYCGNDPVNKVDPDGEYIMIPIIVKIVSAIMVSVIIANQLMRNYNPCGAYIEVPEVPGPADKPYTFPPPSRWFPPGRR
ncbi:MAG: RHS repeat-associated core domain-containing protein [Candidatus Omnitrophota bacterium]